VEFTIGEIAFFANFNMMDAKIVVKNEWKGILKFRLDKNCPQMLALI
jgi:hypothetical protein